MLSLELQKNKKLSYLNKFKLKKVHKMENELNETYNLSPSYVFFKSIIDKLFDIIGWVLILVVIYLWSKNNPNTIFEQGYQACQNALNGGIPLELGNLTW